MGYFSGKDVEPRDLKHRYFKIPQENLFERRLYPDLFDRINQKLDKPKIYAELERNMADLFLLCENK